jgi:rubrerythrin
MACMEHECHECGYLWHDNTPRGNCPQCGAWDVGHYFDEVPEVEYEPEEEE